MSFLLPVVMMIALWAWATGRLRGFRWADLLAIAAFLLSIRLMTRGEWLPALAGFGWAGGWLWHRRGGLRLPVRRGEDAAMSATEARGLLGVPLAADAGAIRAAHRRLIQRVHPDAGGSLELARQVNAARDTLLADLNRSRSGAS